MSTDSYAICRKCKRILRLDKFMHYATSDVEDRNHYRIDEKLSKFLEWAKKHAEHGIHVVDEHAGLMDECHHGWTYEDWETGEEEVRNIPERFRRPETSAPPQSHQ